MGRKLTGQSLKPTPVVDVRTGGKFFIGELLQERREVKVKKGKKAVYEFKVIDTDASIQVKNEDGEYVEATVAAGDKVSVFAPTVLDSALREVQIGTKVKIVTKGMLTGVSGTSFYGFDAEEL